MDFQIIQLFANSRNDQKETYPSNKDGLGKMGSQKLEFFYCLGTIFATIN